MQEYINTEALEPSLMAPWYTIAHSHHAMHDKAPQPALPPPAPSSQQLPDNTDKGQTGGGNVIGFRLSLFIRFASERQKILNLAFLGNSSDSYDVYIW